VVTRFGGLLAGILIIELAWALLRGDFGTAVGAHAGADSVNSTADLGRVLFTNHSFAFEATSILILVAMIGAVVLARQESGQ
jgi:NADH-quinone oxidoreductase subunit J